jgi:non-canonical poly(A) RNA polymerase PAPD5/7
MADSYRPTRRDRDPPPPKSLADRMTFNGNGGDTYRPGGGQHQSDFTFESNHPAPRFPPSGPANGDSRAPARSNRGGGNRGGRRADHRGRGNANGRGRGGPRRNAAAHERALLQHRDDGSPKHTYGVSDGPNRFMNVDDMSDDEEAEMDESDASADGVVAKGQNGEKKVARTDAARADGDAVPQWAPRWSNPDPYTALPPPSESTGVKKDVVQLIRKAKNQAAEKAIGNNAVAANDDFISFGDDDGDDGEIEDAGGLQIYDDHEPIRSRARGQPHRPVQGSMNDVRNDLRRDTYDSYQPPPSNGGRKRKPDSDVPIVSEWLAHSRNISTPWATDPQQYHHLIGTPDKWCATPRSGLRTFANIFLC